MQTRCHVMLLVSSALLVVLASGAQAVNYSVTTTNKNFCCTDPAANPPTTPYLIIMSQVVQSKAVSGAVASNLGSIKVGKSELVNRMTAFNLYSYKGSPPAPPNYKYLKVNNSVVNGAGTLKKSGGYGNFEFCPKSKGPGPGACAFASKASVGFNGRIAVKAGANKFGGTLQLLKGAGGIGGSFVNLWKWYGGPMTYPALHATNIARSDNVGGAPAALVTTLAMGQVYLPGMVPYGAPVTVKNYFNGAGPWTTGTVYVGVTANKSPATRTVTQMGANNRTAMGIGNLQVVSGNLANAPGIPQARFVLGWHLSLPEPSPSLGLAAGSLALLALGLAGSARRRIRSQNRK